MLLQLCVKITKNYKLMIAENIILATHVTLFALKVFPLDYIPIIAIILKMISLSKTLLRFFC